MSSRYNLGPTRARKFATRVLPLIALAIALVLIPALGPSRSMYSLMNLVGINIVFALSYNMLLGQTGQLSFGHAVYFGLGGYGAIHAMNWIETAAIDGGFWAAYPVFGVPVIGFAIGVLAGGVIGWPSCRRAGIPFAMISLGVAELIASAGFILVSIFGGEEGVSGDRMNGFPLFGLNLGAISQVYWFIAFWTFVGVAAMFAFTRTPLGRMAQAVRDNAGRVQFVGYDPQHIRYLVFILSGGFAGMAGGMSAVNFEIFTPDSLSLVPSGLVLLMAYIGGARYFAGPILGAALLTYAQSNLSDFAEAWLLYLGLLFITVVLFAPGGLAGIILSVFNGLTRPGARARLVQWAGQLVAGLLAMVGGVIIIEVAVRITKGYGEVYAPFGVAFGPDSALTWICAGAMLCLGLSGLRWFALRGEAQ